MGDPIQRAKITGGIPIQHAPHPASQPTPGVPTRASRVGGGSGVSGLGGTGASGLKRPASSELQRGTTRSGKVFQPGLFDNKESAQLRSANKVLVLEYSSTGGGHTARSLDPIIKARQDGTLKEGDSVVVLAPPRWPEDEDGKQIKTLHQKVADLKAKGLNVILKQSDKTVTGIYMPEGPSDNVAMLKDFVYKPNRNNNQVSLSDQDTGTTVRLGKGHPAKQILADVIAAVGEEHKGKITVLGDMAPYLQKAAKAMGIENAVEIGNHQGLFIGAARQQLEGKDLSYLSKASSSGLAPKLALVEYDNETNVVRDLAPTLANLGITGQTAKHEARAIALNHLFQCANQLDVNAVGTKADGILVGPEARADNVGAMVYLYLNKYTQGTLDHIRGRINEGHPAYQNALFANCGKEAIVPNAETVGNARDAKNILQVMYAANADGVTNAGFGTTSEFNYLANNGSNADFVAVPVENQHEQEANAAQLIGAIGADRVTSASGADALYAALDALVQKRADQPTPTSHLNGTMANIAAAAAAEGTSGAAHAADLLKRLVNADEALPTMREHAVDAITSMADYANSDAPKQRRRIYKVLVPVLDSIINGTDAVTLRPTAKVPPHPTNVIAAIEMMENNHAALGGIMSIEFDNANAQQLLRDSAVSLRVLMNIEDGEARQHAAMEQLKQLANSEVALGW